MTLHLYAQEAEHDDAYLVGTRESLLRLRDAINEALDNKAQGRSSDSFAEFFAADGEGYDVQVKIIPDGVQDQLLLPYAKSIGRPLGRNEWEPALVPTE